MTASASPSVPPPWRGTFEIPADAWRRWRIGPLSVWIKRLEHEWRLAWQEDPAAPRTGADQDGEPEGDGPAPDGPPETATRERIASHRLGEQLIVAPRLADRSVVVRPEPRFRLAAGGEVELYIGTPLWLAFSTSEPAHPLLDVPIQRPSDSWFGPSTTEGELCYAGRTCARLQSENLPHSPLWAVTRVRLRNRADDSLLLDRINLPVPHLALFAGAGRLWTQSVRVERGAGGTLAEVRIEDGPPPEAEGAERLAQPRVAMPGNVFSRALGALLG